MNKTLHALPRYQAAAYGLFASAFVSFSLFPLNCVAQVCLNGSDPLRCTTIPDSLQNYNANNWVRPQTASEALTLRSEIVDYIWPSSNLPTTLPAATTVWSAETAANLPNDLQLQLGAVVSANASTIERLETTTDGLENTGYLIHPPTQSTALAILHQGHRDWATGNLDQLANTLLEDGWSVLALTMPLTGWNTDRSATLTSGEVTWAAGTTGHNQMFPLPAPTVDGDNAFRFFLEPTMAGINYATMQTVSVASNNSIDKIAMIGFSGGGWTTSLAAAIDPRIETSITVAGSYPLELQATQGLGDAEQTWAGLYDISSGGVASYEELYVLSGLGEERSAIQINNQFDPCCFYGVLGELYGQDISQNVDDLGSGEWQYLLDATHDDHAISSWAQQTIRQTLGQTENVPEPTGTPILFSILVTALVFRRSATA